MPSKALRLDRVTVRLEHSRIHAADCENCDTQEGMLDRIDRAITLAGDLTQEERARLLQITEGMKGKLVVVYGDIVADRFVYGTPKRISREAPVRFAFSGLVAPGG